jgi:hypothetical protein
MSHRRVRRSVIAILCVGTSVLVGGCGGSDAQGAAHATAQSGGAETVLASAEALLRSDERLPASRRVAHPPSAAGTLLDHPRGEPFAHVVDRHVFLLSHAAPTLLLHAFMRDAPPFARVLAGGSVRGRQGFKYWWEEIGVRSADGAPGPRRLSLAIARTGGETVAVRIDARVEFRLPHSVDFTIPSSARWLAAQVIQDAARHGEPPRIARTVPVADPDRVARIAAIVNSLPVYEPTQPAPSCPAGGDSTLLVLTFRSGPAGAIVASVRASPQSCTEAVSLMLPGKPPYALTGSSRLTSVLERETGHGLELP